MPEGIDQLKKIIIFSKISQQRAKASKQGQKKDTCFQICSDIIPVQLIVLK